MLELRTLLNPFSLLSLLFTIFLTKWLFSIAKRSNKNRPPSPFKLPVLGNLHQLGFYPHHSLQSLAQIHGPVMLLHLGNAPTLVVSSAEAAREIMKAHDIIFANRPDSEISRKLLYDYRDLSVAPYGEYWREMRSICVLQLLSPKRVQSFRSIREEETILLVKKIEQSCSVSSAVDLSELFASLTTDIICRVAFGRKYGEGDSGRRFKKLLEEFGALLGVFNIADFIPWLAWINRFTGLDARVDRVFREFGRFLDKIIDDHTTSGRTGMKEDQSQMDFVDVLLQIQNSNADGVAMCRDSMKALILDMFAAGADTIYTALEWTMTEMLRHPRVMKTAQEETRRISGSKPHITEDDIEKSIYLKAIIKESFRLHPAIRLLVPRQSTQDVKIQGYDILAKTRVIINAWAIGRDPATWEEAEEFKPERFLESSIDFKGHDFQLIPFGAGRRGCPGATFATVTMETALASLLHKFNWALPGGGKAEDSDVIEAPGIAVHRKLPLVAVATPHPFL